MIRIETSKAKDEDPLVAAGALTASVTSTLTSITPEASLEIWPPQVRGKAVFCCDMEKI